MAHATPTPTPTIRVTQPVIAMVWAVLDSTVDAGVLPTVQAYCRNAIVARRLGHPIPSAHYQVIADTYASLDA